MTAIISIFLWSVLASAKPIPLDKSSWLALEFNKIKPNRVSFENGKIKIEVQSSAGPVVHKLDQAISVSGFRIKGSLAGAKAVETGDFDEDSVLRFGVVAEGKQTLSGPKRWFAADWVKKLFQLAPPGVGIDKIHFFAITNRSNIVGRQRIHPKSELIAETLAIHFDQDTDFDFNYQFKEPIRAVGLWLSVDGDDSKSSFSTTVSNIELKP